MHRKTLARGNSFRKCKRYNAKRMGTLFAPHKRAPGTQGVFAIYGFDIDGMGIRRFVLLNPFPDVRWVYAIKPGDGVKLFHLVHGEFYGQAL